MQQYSGNPPKIVVTGGEGFIGSHIVREFLREGWRVTVVDDQSSPSSGVLAERHERLEIIHGSVLDTKLLRNAFVGAECVSHQAAISAVQRSIENPIETHNVNLGGTLAVFNAARETGIHRVIYASSSAVYGNTTTFPIIETHPVSPQTPYAVQKAAAELYGAVYNRMYGLEVVGLRYFNVYGPGQDPNGSYAAVIPAFIARMRSGRAPEIHGDGTTTRDFIHVSDVARANFIAATAPVGGTIFNIASGKETSLNELVRIIASCLGISVTPQHASPRAGDISRSVADTSLAKKVLGFGATVSLSNGIDDMIRHSV